MISRENYKAVRIHILTFKENLPTDNHIKKMDEERRHKTDFICSVCLHRNKFIKNTVDMPNPITKLTEERSYPKRCELCLENLKSHIKYKERIQNIAKEKPVKNNKARTVAVQTQETDVNKNINLLNEVLTVFQNKKQTVSKSNTVILKDASMSTEDIRSKQKPKLQVSKVFQFSTNEAVLNINDKSTIIANHEDFIRSQCPIDVLKRKSSSIPQMKSEELRHTNEKTKTKDAIEEVNRMFGNVKRRPNISESNRPLVRNGPRILPVVKRDKTESIDRIWSPCRCHSGDLSSGDSFVKPEYCHHTERKENYANCDKCVYLMCMKNCHKIPPDMCCQCCHGENFRCNRHRPNFDCND